MKFKLRPWSKDDLDNLTRYGCNADISRFMSDGFPDTREKWHTFLNSVIGNSSIFYRAVAIDGEAVGAIGIRPQDDIRRKNAELGYWLGEPFQGKGIMSDAIVRFVRSAFEHLDITRIFARPFETNTASHRILEKAGFTLEARIENGVFKNGVFIDERIYAVRRKQSAECSGNGLSPGNIVP